MTRLRAQAKLLWIDGLGAALFQAVPNCAFASWHTAANHFFLGLVFSSGWIFAGFAR
jgi:hypothetical protein